MLSFFYATKFLTTILYLLYLYGIISGIPNSIDIMLKISVPKAVIKQDSGTVCVYKRIVLQVLHRRII